MAKNTPNTHTIILRVVILEKIITKKVIDERKTRGMYAPPLVLSVGKRGLVLEGLSQTDITLTLYYELHI